MGVTFGTGRGGKKLHTIVPFSVSVFAAVTNNIETPYVYIYIYIYIYLFIFIYVYVYIYIYICIYVYIHIIILIIVIITIIILMIIYICNIRYKPINTYIYIYMYFIDMYTHTVLVHTWCYQRGFIFLSDTNIYIYIHTYRDAFPGGKQVGSNCMFEAERERERCCYLI